MLKVEGLQKRYGDHWAVREMSFELPEGAIYGFVGPNGAGKTTTMKMIATLLSPSAGQAFVDGFEVTQSPKEVRQRLGYMPDFFGVYDNLKVTEYLDFYADCHGVASAARPRLINDLLELVDLGNKRGAYVESLSRGMKQRLCLARALVHDPQVLLLDEPASGLDPRARIELRELLKELGRMGKTILISSHILTELASFCSHVGIVDQGRLIASGAVDEILRQSAGGRLLTIRVLGEAQAAYDLLQGYPEADAVTLNGQELELSFTGDEAGVAALLQALVAAGVAVVSFTEAKGELESVFLQVTSEGVAE